MLVVADQDRAALGKPWHQSLDHPAARLVLSLAAAYRPLFADRSDVRHVVVLSGCRSACRIVLACVQAEVLRQLFRRLRPCDHNGFDGGLQQPRVVHVGPVIRYPRRHRPPRRRSRCAWCLFRGQNTSKISLIRSHRASGISQITPNGFRFRVCFLRRFAILGSFPEKTTMPELVSTPNPRFAETSVFG